MSTIEDTRLYVVIATDDGSERLMRAANPSRAIKQAVMARIATQEDLERLLSKGVKPESMTPSPKPPGRPQVHRRA